MCSRSTNSFGVYVLAAGLTLLFARLAAGDEKAAFEMHQWSVWLSHARADRINPREGYPSSVPWLPVTRRPRTIGNEQSAPSPLNLLTFYGKPAAGRLNVDVRLRQGEFLGSWPAAAWTNTELRWSTYSLIASDGNHNGPPDAPADWFTPARAEGALTLSTDAGRREPFLSYDFEAAFPLPVRLEGGPEKFAVRNTGGYPLYDVVVVVPAEGGKRIGWLDVLRPTAAAASTPLNLSPPLTPGSDRFATFSSKSLTDRLEKAGLNRQESELLVSRYKAAIFAAAGLRVAFRLSPIAVGDLTPVVVEPEPAKTVRVTLLIADELEPRLAADGDQLVKLLGSPKYKEREAAERQLLEMNAGALPFLNQAVNSNDPEIAYRAERVLTKLQSPNGPGRSSFR